jgi:hypothetical protein
MRKCARDGVVGLARRVQCQRTIMNVHWRRSNGRYSVTIEGSPYDGYWVLRRYYDGTWTKVGDRMRHDSLTMGEAIALAEQEMPLEKSIP